MQQSEPLETWAKQLLQETIGQQEVNNKWLETYGIQLSCKYASNTQGWFTKIC